MFDETVMLRHHLQYNHYPPVHWHFDAPALRAIEACSSGENELSILLPNGRRLAAWEIVDGLHLQDFVDARTIYNGIDLEGDPCCESGEHPDSEDGYCLACGEYILPLDIAEETL